MINDIPKSINLVYHGGFTLLYTAELISSQSQFWFTDISRNVDRPGDQGIFKAQILWWSFCDKGKDDDND